MVSELAGEGAMPPQLPTPARRLLKIAKLRDYLRQQIRRGSLLLRRGVTKLKVFYYFNRSIRAVQSINQQRWRRFFSSIVSGSSWSRSAKSLSKVLIIRHFFAIFKRNRSVKFSSTVLVDVVVFAGFSRSSRSRSAKSSSAELVLAISSPQRRTRNKKQSMTPIPDFASEKSQRRISDMKNRVGELRSEIKAATANEAKQIKESMKQKRFRGTVTGIDPPPLNFAVQKCLQLTLSRRIRTHFSLILYLVFIEQSDLVTSEASSAHVKNKQSVIEKKDVQMEMSEWSCVESSSGAFEGEIKLKLKFKLKKSENANVIEDPDVVVQSENFSVERFSLSGKARKPNSEIVTKKAKEIDESEISGQRKFSPRMLENYRFKTLFGTLRGALRSQTKMVKVVAVLSSSEGVEDNAQVISCLTPKQEHLLIENVPDPLAGK
nr:cyclin-SDS [Ipomoea trifida]